jgi:Holliday junction resolvasome RuvABC endonuclease subunit
MNILALDCGTKTGWATLRDGHIESGVQVYDLKRGESAGMRWLRFDAWLEEIYYLVNPRLIVFEQAHHRGGAATAVGVGFTTKIHEFAARHTIETLPVHSLSLKKWATGSGRASKGDMIIQVNRLLRAATGITDITDDNEADAFLLLLYGKEQVGS